ncbi:putative T7SS-secreted protein [Cellulomonas sp. P5_E12]
MITELRARSAWYEDAGQQLRSACTDGWTGSAADAFRDRYAAEPARWFRAADAMTAAADALELHADTVAWADARARHADQLLVLAATSPEGDRLRAEAADVLSDARDQLERSGDDAARRIDEAASWAPQTPTWADHVGDWWSRAWHAGANAGIDAANTLLSVGHAAGQHPEDVAALVGGTVLIQLGAGGEVGGFALDATGVGAVAGVPINIASAALIGAGAVLVAGGAGSLMQHAAEEPVSALDRLPEGEPLTNARGHIGAPDPDPPTGAKPGWIKFRAANGQGWVWQDRDAFNAGGNAWQFRHMDPTDRYPTGYVRMTNGNQQPLGLDGKPGTPAESHLPVDSRGTYPLPENW